MNMARSTFFLRADVEVPATQARVVEEIDLGAYVNLGSTKPQVLRIHSINIQVSDKEGLVPTVDASPGAGTARSAFFNAALTTKPMQIASPQMPFLSADETAFSFQATSTNFNTSDDQGMVTTGLDMAPQFLVNGYLVGVDTLYLYAIADDAWAEEINCSISMECSVEPATRENAINLALSQA